MSETAPYMATSMGERVSLDATPSIGIMHPLYGQRTDGRKSTGISECISPRYDLNL